MSPRFINAVADPGFPVWGREPIRGCGPLTQALFGENVCENERIESHRGTCTGHAPPRSANEMHTSEATTSIPQLFQTLYYLIPFRGFQSKC